MHTDAVEVDVRSNDCFDPVRSSEPDADFVHFPYVLELYGDDEPSIPVVVTVLDGLDRAGSDYVTSADFEAHLPHSGRTIPVVDPSK